MKPSSPTLQVHPRAARPGSAPWASLGTGAVLLVLAGAPALGQQTSEAQPQAPESETNTIVQAVTAVQTNAAALSQELGSNELATAVAEMLGTNEVSDAGRTNENATNRPATGPARPTDTPRDIRASRDRFRQRQAEQADRQTTGPRGSGQDAGTNGPSALDYANFQMIVDRNIFNPNRHAGTRFIEPTTPPQPRVDQFAFVGTVAYEKGIFAVFNSSNYEYQKTLRVTDAIAGYKVTAITLDTNNVAQDCVKLSSGTNELALKMGMSLRRENNGPWAVSQASDFLVGPGSDFGRGRGPGRDSSRESVTSTSTAAPSGADSEVLKRLMERREKE